MEERKFISAADMDRMTPNERAEAVNASICRSWDEVPEPFRSKVRAGPWSWHNGSIVAIERRVRFTEEFFDRLDELLPEERSADGTPSATDFLVFELPSIRDRLAADALDATLMTERSSVRISITSGVLVDRIALYMLVGSTEVVVFDLDLDIGWK